MAKRAPGLIEKVLLRDVTEGDLPIFFEQQLDPDATHMARGEEIEEAILELRLLSKASFRPKFPNV